MKLLRAEATNFGSYSELTFDFELQGLSLVSGSTGAGKSTLMDLVPWVLFSRTAKDGAADEVRRWNSDLPTTGTAVLIVGGHTLSVTRKRGAGNDLYFTRDDGPQERGKDMNDTQKILNLALGLDISLYLSACYMHEFSATSQFFTATAKNRRALCEQLVDLSLAKTLTEKLTADRKDLQLAVGNAQAGISDTYDYIDEYKQELKEYEEKSLTFKEDKDAELRKIAEEIVQLEERIRPGSFFTAARRELQAAEAALGSQNCAECGAPLAHKGLRELHEKRSKLRLEEQQNESRIAQKSRLDFEFGRVEVRVNEFGSLCAKRRKQLVEAQKQLIDWKAKEHDLAVKLMDAETLLDVVTTYRAATIRSTIQGLQDTTNKLLGDHFDAEIKVMFEVESADKLDVTILKDGNQCVYTQLSKGQRQLLRLCFGVAVMRTVANRHGVSFNCAFFDEALSGLDDILKTKAFGLLQQLATEYESVFVIDHHSDFKELFHNRFEVAMTNGVSSIAQS